MREVGRLEAERLEIERDAASLAAAYADEQRTLRDELRRGGGVDLGRVRLQAGASLHGLRRRRELALRGAALLKRLEAARAALVEATTHRRAVELLRERRYQAWLARQRAVEARELDELVTAMYGPSRRTEGPTIGQGVGP